MASAGKAGSTNPEQLFATCFGGASNLVTRLGKTPIDDSTVAAVGLGKDGERHGLAVDIPHLETARRIIKAGAPALSVAGGLL